MPAHSQAIGRGPTSTGLRLSRSRSPRGRARRHVEHVDGRIDTGQPVIALAHLANDRDDVDKSPSRVARQRNPAHSTIGSDQAVNGQQALEQVEAEKPDLVLLDIMMPILDGFGVLARLKANPATRDIPVIIISAMTDMTSVVRGIKLGAEDYLPKPFEPVLLQARLSSGLDKKLRRDQELEYLRHVAAVTDTAAAVEGGRFELSGLHGVAERTDGLGQLARVFERMIQEVQQRELKLKEQVQQLRIEIDQSRKERQVAEITETDYFYQLQQKAANLRQRSKKSGPES